MDSQFKEAAKAYILYRNKRSQQRESDLFEKRINLKPYEYPHLYEYVPAIRHSYWIHSEFNFTSDIQDFKSRLESVARSFGYFFGKDKKVRVNTISQSPTPTTAGKGVKGFDGFIKYADKMSPLGNATAMDCANYTIALFSDLTKRVTLQNLYNDGGFSNMGVSDSIMDMIENS